MAAAGGIETIMVAAGRSRRMGAVNKLLLPVDGVPMVRHSAMLHRLIASPVSVVIGADDHAAADALAGLDIRLIANHDVDAGQQQSVRIGLAAAELNGRGLLIALADQPLLDAADLAALIACFDAQGGTHICVPRHKGVRGNPVLFPTALIGPLRGDAKALSLRHFIDSHPERLVWFEAGNDHFTSDIDTPEDAERILGVAVSRD